MKDFNAKQAKQITDSQYTEQLYDILAQIKYRAEEGKSVLHIYSGHVRDKTKKELTDRGFRVVDHPSIAQQKDNLYYSIYWD